MAGHSRRLKVGGVALLLSLSVVSLLSLWSEDANAYTTRGPITITDDSQFTGANGVTGGSGIAGDPFIISGWEIDTTSQHGIEIRGTTAHFVIKDVFLHGSGDYDGVHLQDLSNGAVDNGTFSNNEYAVSVIGSQGIRIANCTMDLGYWGGIYLLAADGARIVNNTIDNSYDGIYVDSAMSDLLLLNNTISNNDGTGLYLYYELTDSLLQNNTIVRNYYSGIYLYEGGARLQILGNNISENYDGVYSEDTLSESTILENTISNNTGGDGVYIYDGWWNNVSGNVICDNDGTGIYIVEDTATGDSVVCLNTLMRNGYNGIECYGYSTHVGWNRIVDSEDNGIDIHGSLNYIENNTVAGSGDFGLEMHTGHSSNWIEDNVFIDNGMFADLYYQPDMHLYDNTVNGKPLMYLEEISDYVVPEVGQLIARNCQRLTISGQNLSNASVGIEFWDVDESTVHDVVSMNGVYGIYLENSSDCNIISDCVFTDNWHGVHLQMFCEENELVRSDMSDCESTGFYAYYFCTDNTVADSTVKGGTYGMHVSSYSSVAISGCEISLNSWGGIALMGGSGIAVEGCVVHETTYGIYMDQVSSSTLSGNDIWGCTETGIYVYTASTGNTIRWNTVSDCKFGIRVAGAAFSEATHNLVDNNTIASNTNCGIYTEYAKWNTFSWNTISDNACGLRLYGTSSNYNWIYLNDFTANGVHAESTWASASNWFNTSSQVTYYYGGQWWTNYLGNYYDDYPGTDADGDGIGDTPYPVPQEQDYYPLMEEAGVIIPEFDGALLPVLALTGLLLIVRGFARRSRKS